MILLPGLRRSLTFVYHPPTGLKPCAGTRKGQYSIRVNDQWRVCFVWTDRGAMEIEVTDYH